MVQRVLASFALFFGSLTLLNCAWSLARPGSDLGFWWFSFAGLPVWLSELLLAIFGMVLISFALRQPRSVAGRRFSATVVMLLAGAAILKTAGFYQSMLKRENAGSFAVPLGLPIAFGLLLLVYRVCAQSSPRPRPSVTRLIAGSAAWGAFFPLVLMLLFGNSDFRRPADAAVVLGARVYADGRLSDALEDRVRMGCELYHSGLVKKLVFSGGRGDGPLTEAAAMRLYGLAHGVADADMVVDDHGHNTWATVQDTVPLFRKWGLHRVLAVSHFYHLPRVKLAYERFGFDVCTVPAPQNRWLRRLPLNVIREDAAFWAYLLW